MKQTLKFPSPRLAVAASASLVALALLASPTAAQVAAGGAGGGGMPAVTDKSVSRADSVRVTDTNTVDSRKDKRSKPSATMPRDRKRDTTGTPRDTLPPDSSYVPVRPGF